MEIIKIMVCAFFMVALLSGAKAQDAKALLGKWETVYKDKEGTAHITYEFVNENGQLLCYTRYIADEGGNGSEYNTLAMKNIHFKAGTGKALFMYKADKEVYELKASLELEGTNALQVSYSYWGYSDTEQWKKVQ
ncbi:MAG: hypothetical protein AAGA86_04800 [Bacteroidota bacterium]